MDRRLTPRAARAAAVLLACLAATSGQAQVRRVAPAAPPAPRPVATARADTAPTIPAFHAVTAGSYVLSRMDDNVNRDPVGVTSIGGIGGVTARYTSGPTRPLLMLEYDAAVHRYTATTRFNRVSQRLRSTLTRRLIRPVTFELVMEGALKGSSEDRDVSDGASVIPRLDFRVGANRRLRIGAAQRWRRFATDSLQDATNRYLTAELRHRFAGGAGFEQEVRVERNQARGARFDFERLSYATTLSTPVGRAVVFEVGMQYRLQRYAGRLVEIDDDEVARVDHRLQPSAGLIVHVGASSLEMSYEPEFRRSNDPDKAITQNVVVVGLRHRWF
jgi:hypothetical protein